MIASPLANNSHGTRPSNHQELKKLSGELFSTLKSVDLERDIDPADSFRRLVTSNYEKKMHLSLDKRLRFYDVAKEYCWNPLDSELTQLQKIEGYPKEGASYSDQSSISSKFGATYHALEALLIFSENDTLSAGIQKVEPNWNFESQKSNHGQKAFVLLAQAKKLLIEQRIQDARRILQSGTHQYPKDTGIARLLRAISPGQVTKVKSETANGNQEIAWIRQHGKKYQGKWIAVRNSELLASSRTLKSLLDKLKQLKGKVEPVTIQYIVPE